MEIDPLPITKYNLDENYSMEKIAIPVDKNKLCKQFEECDSFAIFTLQNNKSLITYLEYGQSSLLLPEWLAGHGITDLIANHIETYTIDRLNQYKIHVFPGVRTLLPQKIMDEYLSGTLETMDAPD